jgi:hypothetical protein
MTVRNAPRHLSRDTSVRSGARGRNTSFPAGYERKQEIIGLQNSQTSELSDEEYCMLVDTGALHCRAISKMLGRTRTFSDYSRARTEALTALNNAGPGAAGEIVAGGMLVRAGLKVDCTPGVADLQTQGRHLEVKSSYMDDSKNARSGHQSVIGRNQIDSADYLLASLVNGPGRTTGFSETTVHWVFAPMSVVASHVNARFHKQAGKDAITLHYGPQPAREAFAPYTHTNSLSLLNAIRETFSLD